MKWRELTRRRGPQAALSVVLGTGVGAAVNIVTSAWDWAAAAAGGIALIFWAALEWTTASHAEAPAPGPAQASGPSSSASASASADLSIDLKVDSVEEGEAVAMSVHPDGATPYGRVEIRQEVKSVKKGGKVIGYRAEGRGQ